MFTSVPKLPNRQNLIDKFSMYMIGENNVSYFTIKWKTEPHLQRNIELYKSRNAKFASLFNQQDNGRGLVQFWIDMALNRLPPREEWEPQNRIQKAWEHLRVYCEESCYKAALEVGKYDYDFSTTFWEEYIFLARCLLYESINFQDILRKYNFHHSSFDTYITGILIKSVKNEVFVAKFSKWRLLYQKSNKELKEALMRAGRDEPEISRFLFARKYFKQVYQMNKIQNPAKRKGQKWQEPDTMDFSLSAKYYNAQMLLPSAPHEVTVSAHITGEQLKSWMEVCIAALQNYPKSITPCFSLDALQEKRCDAESVDYLEILEQSEVEDSIGNQETLVKQTELALQEQLLSLKSEQQEILLLYYGLELNQKQIAERFKVTQGAIARRLQTIEIKLLKTVCGLSQPPEWVKQYVALWLVRNYQAPLNSDLIHVALVKAVKKLEIQEQKVLQFTYGHKLDEHLIANRLGISQPELIKVLHSSQYKLEAALIKEIDIMISKYLQFWLAKTFKAIVKSAYHCLEISPTQAASLETTNSVLKASLKILLTSKH
jgi:RNA polymerase sigma factor (sigma-70 family)